MFYFVFWNISSSFNHSSKLSFLHLAECPSASPCLELSHKGSPTILEWVAYPFSSGSSWQRNQNRVSCNAGGFFTNWAIIPLKTHTHTHTHTHEPLLRAQPSDDFGAGAGEEGTPYSDISSKKNQIFLLLSLHVNFPFFPCLISLWSSSPLTAESPELATPRLCA